MCYQLKHGHSSREASRERRVFLLDIEDVDVVFCHDFNDRVRSLNLPHDWGLFYFGCQHAEAPHLVSPGIVRVSRALDMHAVGIRSNYFLTVRAAMRGGGKGMKPRGFHSDYLLSNFHKRIPTYAAYPNLAWQSSSYSDNTGKASSSFMKPMVSRSVIAILSLTLVLDSILNIHSVVYEAKEF